MPSDISIDAEIFLSISAPIIDIAYFIAVAEA
jgi:hypothetical protein